MTVIAEGKTKIIREIPGSNEVCIESKDDITAGDGARRHSFHGKGAIATTTAANCFGLLSRRGVPNHFLAREGPRTFRARRCAMIPIEIVTRRISSGSITKREPPLYEGIEFMSAPRIEFYLKDDANHDPFMRMSDDRSEWLLFDPRRPSALGPIARRPFHGIRFGDSWVVDHIHVQRLEERAMATFLALETAWAAQNVTLVDCKIECGVDLETRDLLVADVIDNDSWRIWPDRDKRLMKDKQTYRDAAVVTPETLMRVRDNYFWVAGATSIFPP